VAFLLPVILFLLFYVLKIWPSIAVIIFDLSDQIFLFVPAYIAIQEEAVKKNQPYKIFIKFLT